MRPAQLALLHLSGHGRVPDGPLLELNGRSWYPVGSIPVEHWLYRPGTTLTQAIDPRSTTLRIADPRRFGPVQHGFSDDILLVDRTRWTNAEHARIVAVDRSRGIITVKRGMFGTKAISHLSGCRVLPHVADRSLDGGTGESWQWFYNFSTTCPRDSHNRTASDVVADQIAQLFSGPFAQLDGLEFDVEIYALSPSLGGDTNNDGTQDDGVIGNRNVWGAGLDNMLARLRASSAMRGKLILCDDGSVHARPPTSLINGVESEGWPTSGDSMLELWSDGLNRMQFWQTHARLNTQGCPSLSYIVLKARSDANVTPSQTRVMAAAAAFFGVPLAIEELPYTPDALGAVIDELVGGSQGPGHGSLGWLGKAAGPGAHLVLGKPDVLGGYGTSWARLVGLTLSGCTAARDQRPNRPPALRLTPRNPERVGDKWQGGGHPPFVGPDATTFSVTTPDFRFTVPNGAPHDLVVQCTFDGDDMPGYAGLGRLVLMRCRWDVRGVPHFQYHFARVSGTGRAQPPSLFYFRDLAFPGDSVTFSLTITAECGNQPMWLTRLTAHAGSDYVYREFANGVVLINPSSQPYRFPTARLFGSRRGLTRLHWSAGQPRDANTGAAVSDDVLVPSRDALFLRFR